MDLPAYLARIGMDAVPTPDAAGLAAMQRAHRLAIPFENLDIPLGRGISIDPAIVFDKLVTRRRGGYCFEQNQLFLRALRAVGFAARPLLARVWLMADGMPPLTHTFNLVTIGGREWIADAGFGGSFSPPMPLEDGATSQMADGTAHRLVRRDDGWMLERSGDPGATDGRSQDTRDWQPQYSFTTAPVEGIDLELSNHWTSTRPGTRFLTMQIVSLILPDGFAALTDRQLSLHRAGVTESRPIQDAADYRTILASIFGLELSVEEVDRLSRT
ncbi:MAG: arylamine N-acetyltransferase family protein [Sphingobium phenoxybenzoativorans]